VLVSVWQYEFLVRTGTCTIILKHAVDMIESAPPEAVPAGSPDHGDAR
jgi:hypothetical protein